VTSFTALVVTVAEGYDNDDDFVDCHHQSSCRINLRRF